MNTIEKIRKQIRNRRKSPYQRKLDRLAYENAKEAVETGVMTRIEALIVLGYWVEE